MPSAHQTMKKNYYNVPSAYQTIYNNEELQKSISSGQRLKAYSAVYCDTVILTVVLLGKFFRQVISHAQCTVVSVMIYRHKVHG